MAARTRLLVSARSYAASGDSGSDGINAAGSDASFRFSLFANGEVDSIALMRTIVRPSRFSSEPIFVARSASDGLTPELATELFPRGLEFAALAPDAARPRVFAQRVDHGTADAAFSKGFELDPAAFVEAVGRVNESKHAVLHQVADVDGVGHRGRNSTG